MIVTYTKIIGTPMMEIKAQTKLGTVEEIVFNKTNLKISGITVKSSGMRFLSKLSVVSTSDIIEITPQAVIAKNSDSLVGLEETPRIKESIKEGYFGIDQKVYTKKGKRIGKVTDLYIDSITHQVTKLLVKSVFSERLISTNLIVDMKGKKIIIKDDYEMSKASPAFAQSVI